MATIRPVRQADQGADAIANTTAVANSNNVGDLPSTVNSILEALRDHGFVQAS